MFKIAYICDQKRDCSRFEYCRKCCLHTTDEFHTKNGIIHNVDELYSERFIKVGTVNEVTYFMEVDNDREEHSMDKGCDESEASHIDESKAAGGDD